MEKKMTTKLFDAIKIMTKGGATLQEISTYLDVSTATISRVRTAETFEEYKNVCAARSIAYRQKLEAKKAEEQNNVQEVKPTPTVVERPQVIQVQATHYMMEELRKLNETMTLISNKLSFIVDQLQ